ncbi:hypothetical protein MKK75_27065 [Methylobacterium sp. J-030]|uniref:hypothetical protein n=1 Tax=Methylobacterium sp. J-030 TaxID=2836627 RepID=UPI001FBAEC4D|nr:hypothetical protein [Methylobacterium sp. J-030]MCJ2072409.1 hypothetical protein [Methylobacterium sp. J-030]
MAYVQRDAAGNIAGAFPQAQPDLVGYAEIADDDPAYLAFRSGATVAELLRYASNRQNGVLAGVWSFNVAPAGQPAHTVTTKLDDQGQFAMMKVDVWAQTNAASATAALPYSNVDFSATTLNPSEASALAVQAGVVDAQSYTILNQVAAGIQASPPTITATAQIDAAFAAMVQAPAAS